MQRYGPIVRLHSAVVKLITRVNTAHAILPNRYDRGQICVFIHLICH